MAIVIEIMEFVRMVLMAVIVPLDQIVRVESVRILFVVIRQVFWVIFVISDHLVKAGTAARKATVVMGEVELLAQLDSIVRAASAILPAGLVLMG